MHQQGRSQQISPVLQIPAAGVGSGLHNARCFVHPQTQEDDLDIGGQPSSRATSPPRVSLASAPISIQVSICSAYPASNHTFLERGRRSTYVHKGTRQSLSKTRPTRVSEFIARTRATRYPRRGPSKRLRTHMSRTAASARSCARSTAVSSQ